MTHKIGQKGQVVIPKEIRDELGLKPGSEVAFESDGRSVNMRAQRSLKELGGSLAGGPSMADALLEDRRRERR